MGHNYPIDVSLYRITFVHTNHYEYFFSEEYPAKDLSNIFVKTIEDIEEITSIDKVPTKDRQLYPKLSYYLDEVDMDSNINNFFNGKAFFHAL